MKWYKSDNHTTTDIKLRLVTKKSDARHCETLALWQALLEKCSQGQGDEIKITPGFYDELEYQLDIPAEKIKHIYTILSFPKSGLMKDSKVLNWEKYQGDSSTQRTREYRERMKQKEQSQNVTERHGDDVTQRRGEEKREEVVDAIGKPIASATQKIHKGTRIDPDMKFEEKYLEYASRVYPVQMDIMPVVFEEFKDYWLARSGRDASKLDWLATWRNRLKTVNFETIRRNHNETSIRSFGKAVNRGGVRKSTGDQIAEGIARIAEEYGVS